METKLRLESHAQQVKRWPASGRHILAQWDAETVVVYQAYRPSIGHFAARHGYFGGDYSFSRMSWVKPNFLWMMYRSGWGTKLGQEVTLAIRLTRAYFDRVLESAVASGHSASTLQSKEEWRQAIAASDVRLQWDPDHDPHGKALERRAIQLGIRGMTQKPLGEGGDAIVEIEDVSSFVEQQRLVLGSRSEDLMMPREEPYPVADRAVAARLRVDDLP